MKKYRDDRRGVSRSIGALMLVLIVVIAATSFAIFLNKEQNAVQTQQLDTLSRTEESMKVLSVDPSEIDGKDWNEMNLTVVSLDNEQSMIDRIAINDVPIGKCTVWSWNGKSWNPVNYTIGTDIPLQPAEEIIVHVNLTGDLMDPTTFPMANFIKVDLYTYLLNDFTSIFNPPNAIADLYSVSEQNISSGNGPGDYILDGTSSTPAVGAQLQLWNWIATAKDGKDVQELSGSEVRFQPTQYGEYWINLTVTDNNGMIGHDSITLWVNNLTIAPQKPQPPAAIATISMESQWNGTALNYTNFLILDSSQSTASPGTSIIARNWTILLRSTK